MLSWLFLVPKIIEKEGGGGIMRGRLGSTKVGGSEGIQKHTLGGQIFTKALTEYFFN